MSDPAIIQRVLENFINLNRESRRRLPFLHLPRSAKTNVLRQLHLTDIIQLSLLSQRTKHTISFNFQIDKSQFTCKIWCKNNTTIYVTSPFGSFTGSLEHIDHVVEVLNYPYLQVIIDGEQAVNQGIEWVNDYRGLVTTVKHLTDPPNGREIQLFVNQMIECGVLIEFCHDMVIDCSMKNTVRIQNPIAEFMPYIWGLKCQYLQVNSGKIDLGRWKTLHCTLSKIERVIFELTDKEEVDGQLQKYCKKSEDRFLHPIYGTIKECYKIRDEKEWKEATLFKTEHDGKQLLVMDIQYFVALDIIEKNLDFIK
ncbi:hypothetical protein CAEBREN_05878 [Caenorhabditis brenneri]|uniref:F-box domain-containing protein n=1 Tax=Caenorhabditis brenneri TaxID=135651 RepID=G0NVP5_CAEBE|nr:hypothetical protein CAEBREN_05878 [Caenorhabditis brenneri]